MSGIYTFRKLVLLVLGICWLNTLGAAEPEKVVYKVDIKDEIGPEVWRLARKSFDLAGQEKADYILIHMNTYGGLDNPVFFISFGTLIRSLFASISCIACNASSIFSLLFL